MAEPSRFRLFLCWLRYFRNIPRRARRTRSETILTGRVTDASASSVVTPVRFTLSRRSPTGEGGWPGAILTFASKIVLSRNIIRMTIDVLRRAIAVANYRDANLLPEHLGLAGRCGKGKDLALVGGFAGGQGEAGDVGGFVGFDKMGGFAFEVGDEVGQEIDLIW